MSSTQNESLTATNRILSVKTLPMLDEQKAAPSPPQGGSQTIYLAFQAPLEPPIEDVEITVPAVPSDLAAIVQSQSLELAANRAEMARYQREHEDLQRAVRMRDGWLKEMRAELKVAQEDRRVATTQLAEERATLQQLEAQLAQRDAQIKELEADVAERMGKTIFPSERIRPVPAAPSEALGLEHPAMLVPLDGDGTPIVLDRKIVTVGRTRDNHVFVHSQLASRDHARILVSEDKVVVFDVGSANGCFVNDEQVRRRVLREGDVVRFADRGYRFSKTAA